MALKLSNLLHVRFSIQRGDYGTSRYLLYITRKDYMGWLGPWDVVKHPIWSIRYLCCDPNPTRR
jgi:hypothetical protein